MLSSWHVNLGRPAGPCLGGGGCGGACGWGDPARDPGCDMTNACIIDKGVFED